MGGILGAVACVGIFIALSNAGMLDVATSPMDAIMAASTVGSTFLSAGIVGLVAYIVFKKMSGDEGFNKSRNLSESSSSKISTMGTELLIQGKKIYPSFFFFQKEKYEAIIKQLKSEECSEFFFKNKKYYVAVLENGQKIVLKATSLKGISCSQKGSVSTWYKRSCYFLTPNGQGLLKAKHQLALEERNSAVYGVFDDSLTIKSALKAIDPTLKGIQDAHILKEDSGIDKSHKVQLKADCDFSKVIESATTFNTALEYMDQLISGLHTLYKAGYIHLDLKPDNILLLNGEARITDYGDATKDSFSLPLRSRYHSSDIELLIRKKYIKRNEYPLQGYSIVSVEEVHKHVDVASLGAILIDVFLGKRTRLGIHTCWKKDLAQDFKDKIEELLKKNLPKEGEKIIPILVDMVTTKQKTIEGIKKEFDAWYGEYSRSS